MTSPYRVLLIEDSAEDAFFNLRVLERGGLQLQFERVETAAQLEEQLAAKTWDFILSDHRLPGFDAFAALNLYKDAGLDIPFIVVSGQIGEEQAVKLLKAGAHDYVMKDKLAGLLPAVNRELLAAQERRIKQRAHDTEQFLASMVRDCNDAIFGTTLHGSLITWNKGAEKLYGYSASEVLGGPVAILEADGMAKQSLVLERLKSGEIVSQFETVHLRKNRTPLMVSLSISPVRENSGRVIGASTVAQDNSTRKQDEREKLDLIRELAEELARTRNQNSRSENPIRQTLQSTDALGTRE